MRCNALVLIRAGAVVLAGIGTAAAAYPDRPIQIVIQYSPGGSTDLLARTMGKVAPKYIPVPWMVVNKPGGSGMPGRNIWSGSRMCTSSTAS